VQFREYCAAQKFQAFFAASAKEWQFAHHRGPRHGPCSSPDQNSRNGTFRFSGKCEETTMADDIDLHVGKRLRRRRRLLGMTQQDLAGQVGVRFQQIQKYECGANRVTASRLYDLSRALNVSVQYFFDGIVPMDAPANAANDAEKLEGDILSQKETLELVRAYYRLGERPRKRLLELAKALEEDSRDQAGGAA
jgi:transcriptional regulator with XRE-family HTH domain